MRLLQDVSFHRHRVVDWMSERDAVAAESIHERYNQERLVRAAIYTADDGGGIVGVADRKGDWQTASATVN